MRSSPLQATIVASCAFLPPGGRVSRGPGTGQKVRRIANVHAELMIPTMHM